MTALRWLMLSLLLTQAAMCGNKGPLVVPEPQAGTAQVR